MPEHAHPWIEVVDAQLREVEDLHVKLQPVPRADIPDAALLLFDWAAAREALTRRGALIFARDIVEEVLPVARRAAIFQLAILLAEEAIRAGGGEAGQFVFAAADGAREQIREAMRVAGDEVDWSRRQAHVVQQLADRRPPLARGADEADVRAAEHAQGEVLALLAHGEQVGPEVVAPDDFEAPPVLDA